MRRFRLSGNSWDWPHPSRPQRDVVLNSDPWERRFLPSNIWVGSGNLKYHPSNICVGSGNLKYHPAESDPCETLGNWGLQRPRTSRRFLHTFHPSDVFWRFWKIQICTHALSVFHSCIPALGNWEQRQRPRAKQFLWLDVSSILFDHLIFSADFEKEKSAFFTKALWVFHSCVAHTEKVYQLEDKVSAKGQWMVEFTTPEYLFHLYMHIW